jgi:hypothetical protein
MGLTMETFVSPQRELAPTVVDALAVGLRNFQIGDVGVIFAGIDNESAHLYQADGATVQSRDAMGSPRSEWRLPCAVRNARGRT